MCFSDLLNPVVRVAYSVVWFDVTEHGVVKPKMGDEKKGPASDSVDALTDEAQKQFERFVQGAHQMTACALAAIDACSADVPQTVQLLELLAKQGDDRKKKQECLDSLQSAFEKHMTEYEEEEQKYMQRLWSSVNAQEQDLQIRLEAGNQLQKLRLQKQKVGEALLWLELMSGPPAM
ncbi:hypothetical protein M758_11G074300 [Ceratodon purpureus]|uniref:Uncharacterized protein n=1 Tax=Ceratodon purpureus TaxID=3225 RepID=A0A8T0GDF8_CERPU|nr:hypothetical protein KC19_11G076500 [Ceratodon purpureus]KAG0600961.1 hypothetical protein M758_11G074300 [Ceratodon purpureus]